MATTTTSQSFDLEHNGCNEDVYIPPDSTDDRDGSSDQSDDNGGNSDEDKDDSMASLGTGINAESLLGITISRAQADMKSPITPAATKAQALDASKSYFATEPEEEILYAEEPLLTSSNESTHRPDEKFENVTRTGNRGTQEAVVQKEVPSGHQSDKRSSFVSSMLNSAGSTRPRASSGSSMVENIRRRLPGMPSMSLSKIGSFSDSTKKTSGFDAAGSPRIRAAAKDQTGGPQGVSKQQGQPVDGAVGTSSSGANTSDVDGSRRSRGNDIDKPRSGSLRRVRSDNSLYLQRTATEASEYDDYNAFENVSEMVNSRFKAISDSFQDSAFRVPKLSSIKAGRTKNKDRIDDDETKANTRMNRGSMQPSNVVQQHQPQASAAGKSSKHPILKQALSRVQGDLIIMGGYRGSILREAQPPHRQLWVPIKVGMNLRKADLEVGLTREDEDRMEEKIIAGQTLSHIGPIDISRRLLKKCKHCPSAQSEKLRVHDYGYDWRLSPNLLSDRFIKFLESLPCNRKSVPVEQRGAWIIAHSLGGLLTRHAINRRPELFAGVVYAGTPQNCVNILGPLRNGDDVLFSSRVLTAQVNFTLRTSFVLLPQSGRCFINKETGERYDIDFFDAKNWEEYHLSPCIKPPLRRNRPEKKTGIMGSISDAMSGSGTRSSWFSSSTSVNANSQTMSGSSSPASRRVKETAEDVKENVAEAAEAAKPDQLSPSMSDGQAKHKPNIATQSTLSVPDATAYLSRTLGSVLDFKQNLSHISELQSRNAYPPAAILFAKNTPTVYGAFVSSKEAIKYDDCFDDLAFAAGDGVVLASAAQLPMGYRCVKNGRIESERGHVGLLGDIEGVGQCLNAIIDAKQRGVGSGAHGHRVKQSS